MANWRGGDVDVNVNRNTNINNNIDRSKYQNKVTGGQGGQGKWQHNPEHRKGVSYRDQNTRQQYGQSKPGAENRKISEDKRLIQETEQVLTEEGKIHPVERQDPQLLTEEEKIHPVETPGVAEIRQRSNPGSRMLSTVQIEAETMPKCPVIVEAAVARACPRPVAVVVEVEEEVSPVAVVVEVEEDLSGGGSRSGGGGGGGGGGRR